MIDWRQQRLPLIGFEAACGGETPCGERARVVVLNAFDTGLRYLALLLQDIPRSCKLDSQLNYVTWRWVAWNWRRCRWANR